MKFTAKEVKAMVYEDDFDSEVIETIEGEDRRWSRTNITIIKHIKGKFYELYWEHGLTENQENEFEDQDAPEVKQVEKTTIVKSWVRVK